MKTELTAGRQRKTPPELLGYGLAAASVFAALALAKWLQIQFDFEPFVPFICAIMISVWFGGAKPGLLAVALSLLAFDQYLPSYNSLNVKIEMSRLISAALTALFVLWLCAAQKSATDALRQTNESLLAEIAERKQAEFLLHAQAQEVRAIVENSPDFIIRFDRQLRRTFVNTAFIKASGLPKEKLLGREIASAAKDGVVKATAEEIATLEVSLQRAFNSGRPLDFECTWPLVTGRGTFTVHLEPEVDAGGALTSILAIARDITERKRAGEALRNSHAHLRALSARLQSVREEEATRISREIHDDLGQNLTGLKMDLLRAERKIEELESSPAVNLILDTIISATELVDGISSSVQEIAADLRPPMLDKLGLGAALQYEARRFQDRTGILCETRLPETEPKLSAEISIALFRIFQECLTNVVRHAQATKVEAELEVEAGFAVLSLRDNGKGITKADIANPQSLGLLGIAERAGLLGGEAVLEDRPGQGTNVTVRIPMTGVPPATGKPI